MGNLRKMSFEIQKASVNKNPFIGLFARASDKHCLIAKSMPHQFQEVLKNTLQVPLLHVTVSQSNLLGIFAVMNSNGVVVSEAVEASELNVLKSHSLNVIRLPKLSAGNALLCNDKACIASPLILREDLKKISDCLGVEIIIRRSVAGFKSFGLLSIATNNGVLLSNECSDEEVVEIKNILKVKSAGTGTGNVGNFNGISIVANSKGAVAGEMTTGVETQQIYQSLGGEE